MTNIQLKSVYVDPSSKAYYEDRLFTQRSGSIKAAQTILAAAAQRRTDRFLESQRTAESYRDDQWQPQAGFLYITEKIFDCLYVGTIPLYLGAKDIADLIPEDTYIDCRRFFPWEEMHGKVMGMSGAEIRSMCAAGRAFIRNAYGLKYYNSLIAIFHEWPSYYESAMGVLK